MYLWKRTINLSLAAVALLAALCSGAWAAPISVTPGTTVWTTGEYVVDSNVSISDRITVAGDVTLILNDGCLLNAPYGINVSGDHKVTNSLTIKGGAAGTGRLFAFSGFRSNNAAIGGGLGEDGGTITIDGGDVTAASELGGAGVGGGAAGSGGTITINGGTVTANSVLGAGIGGGEGKPGGTFMINGGTVNASSVAGTGIGRGWVDPVFEEAIKRGLEPEIPQGTLSSILSDSAWIVASSIGPTDMSKFTGVIFDDSDGGGGRVYRSATIRGDVAVPNGKMLTIPQGSALTIPADATLDASNGRLVINGRLVNDGVIVLSPSMNEYDIKNMNITGTGTGKILLGDKWFNNKGLAFHTIKVTHGSGGNAVASASEDVIEGTEITLIASPDPGYMFNGWNVVKPESRLTFTNGSEIKEEIAFLMPDEDVEIEAMFIWEPGLVPPSDQIIFQITVNSSGGGKVYGRKIYGKGDKVALFALADPGYLIGEWRVVKPESGLNLSYLEEGMLIVEFIMPNEDVEIEVTFKKIPAYSITVNGDGNGSGSASDEEAREGANVMLFVLPRPGYEFSEWRVVKPESGLTITDNIFTMPGEDVEIEATFKKIPTYSITVNSSGDGSGNSNVIVPKEAERGRIVRLYASPAPGYVFDSWEVVYPAELVITNDSFEMPDKDVSIEARFKPSTSPTPGGGTTGGGTTGGGTTGGGAPGGGSTDGDTSGGGTNGGGSTGGDTTGGGATGGSTTGGGTTDGDTSGGGSDQATGGGQGTGTPGTDASDEIIPDDTDGLWNARVGGDLTIHIDEEFSKFDNAVSLDGVPLVIDTTVSNDFGAREGSTIVTIWEHTLRKHITTDGEHKAEVGFKDGSAIHKFNARGTGETDRSSGGACSAGFGLVAIAALAMMKRRQR